MSSSELIIGMLGISTEPIDSGQKGYCWFPIGKPDPRARGGHEWQRIRITAINDIQAHQDVIVVDDKKNVKEYTLESPLINEKKIKSNTSNINDGDTEEITSFETNGYNKITGFIYADQDLTVYIEQSFDNSNWDVQSTLNYTAETLSGGFSVEVIAPYARVRFSNSSGTDTSECRKLVRLSAGV